MINITSVEEFNKYKALNTVFIFSANWCPDCRFIEPFLPEIEKMFPQYTFAHVDRDQFIDICLENNVLGIPSFIVYKNNQVIGTFISKFRKTKMEIIDFLNKLN